MVGLATQADLKVGLYRSRSYSLYRSRSYSLYRSRSYSLYRTRSYSWDSRSRCVRRQRSRGPQHG